MSSTVLVRAMISMLSVPLTGYISASMSFRALTLKSDPSAAEASQLHRLLGGESAVKHCAELVPGGNIRGDESGLVNLVCRCVTPW